MRACSIRTASVSGCGGECKLCFGIFYRSCSELCADHWHWRCSQKHADIRRRILTPLPSDRPNLNKHRQTPSPESGSAAQTGSRNSQQEKEEPRFAYEHAAYVSLEEEANKGKEKEKQKEALSGQLSSDPSANLRKILEAHPSERKAALLERITSAKLNYALVYLTTTLSGNQTLSSSRLAGREKRAPLSSSTATPTTTTQTGHKVSIETG